MIHLELLRFSSGRESTLGLLHRRLTETGPAPQREFLCFVLEDEARETKVPGETRISSGAYRVTLRSEGGFATRYAKRYGWDRHPGMLWIRDVPNFEYVLVHVGNDEDDTAGCLIVGDQARQNVSTPGQVLGSWNAYDRAIIPIIQAIAGGEECVIDVVDFDGYLSGVAADAQS